MGNALIEFKHGEIDRVEELEKRIVDFLPGAKDVPHNVRMAMAQIAIAHGLDPFLREVWPIPKGGNNYELFIGISGWRNAAHRSGEYWGRRFEKVSDEEREWLAAGPKDLVVKCVVMRRKSGQHAAEFDGYGIAKQTDQSKMNKFQLARLRAERDAMKAAFPISSPFGVVVKAVDDDGDEINGDHGPDLPSLSRYDASQVTGEIIDPAELLKANRATLGRDDGDLTAIKTTVTDSQASQARAEFPEAESKFDTPQPTAQAKPEDGGRKLFEDYCETRNLPEFKRFALLNSAGGDYVTALEFAKKVK